jgi:hypothetical protein
MLKKEIRGMQLRKLILKSESGWDALGGDWQA